VPRGPAKTLTARLEEALREKEKKELYDIYDNSQFAKEFLKFEGNHPQVWHCSRLYLNFKKRTQFKVGMMYVKADQVHAKDWFSNLHGTPFFSASIYGLGVADLDPRFWKLMKRLGKRYKQLNIN
jgi:hypothetical protein